MKDSDIFVLARESKRREKIVIFSELARER